MRSAKGRNLRIGRISECGRIYFISVCTYRRRPVFVDAGAARMLCCELAGGMHGVGTQTLACVVMPDHMHWLLQLDAATTLDRIVGGLKGRSARYINEQLQRRGSLWQRGYHDHALRRHENMRDAARYLIHNPVRAGIVSNIHSYPYWDTVWHRRGICG